MTHPVSNLNKLHEFIYSRRCFTLRETSSVSDSESNSKNEAEGMNELQDNVLESENLLNLSERNQEENEKIVGMDKTSPLRKMPVKWDSSKIL